jgi:hypothetical protein
MIEAHWPRLCGIHVGDAGSIAAVWIAHDKDADTLHLYDVCVFEREVLAVIAEGLKRRGKWIPVAWCQEAAEIAGMLLEHGVNMLPDLDIPKNSEAVSEMVSLEIWERMRTGRFKVAKSLTAWLEEFKTFQRQESKVPANTHPLMAATRHALANLSYAQRQNARQGINYPQMAIV